MKRLLLRTCFVVLLAFMALSNAKATVVLNSTNFPDANFRAAVATAAGVNDGDSFNEASLTELDVSNKGITDLTGVEKLTALTKLVAANNDIQFVRLTGNTHLEWLDLSGNEDLIGFSTSTATASNHYINLTPSSTPMPLKHLDLSDCNIGYFQAIYNTYGVNTLTWLSLANNPPMAGWSSGITAQKNLVYCDLTNTQQTSTTVGFTADHTKLETLILANNSSFGWSTSFQYLSGLKYLDVSHCDLYFREGTSTYYLLHYLTPENNPNLETIIANNSQMGQNTEGLTGFENLKTVNIAGNSGIKHFWVNGSPSLESLDITGNTGMTYLQLNEDGLPRNSFTLTGGATCTALNSLYLNGNNYSTVAQATSDFSSISSLAFLYLENNSGFTGGELTMSAADCGNLTGLDLGNNGFTSFLAESLPESLTALMLGNNTAMTRLEMHNNPGIKTMTASPTMTDGSGLYLLGNSALTYMDISGTEDQANYFQRIGNNESLKDVPIDTLKASYNRFYTFRNLTPVAGDNYERWNKNTGVYDNIVSNTPPSLQYYYYAYWPSSPAQLDSASLEQLTGLKYLDLSHCQLKDSVYLHKNTELRYLDVSHNRTIKRYTTSQDKGKAYRESIPANSSYNRSFEDYKKYLWLVDLTPKYPGRQENYDQEYYTLDYNDTTGLYILDLMDNDKLEYLDVSYTGIEQTALTHCHVSNARFMWIQDLHNLKELYADYNGMRSMGIGTANGKRYQEGLKSLERLSVIGMRGADVTTMQGSMNFRADSRCKNLHYINLSYSDFDSIGFYAPQIDTIIIKGNPIHHVNVQTVDAIKHIDATECAFKQRGFDPETGNTVGIPATIRQRYNYTNYNTGVTETREQTITMNGARIGGVYTGALTTPWSGMRSIRAHNRPELTTVLVDNSNALAEVFCHHDPKLTEIQGFDNLPYSKSIDSEFGFPVDADSLRLVYVNDNDVFNKLDLSHNVNLNYLHAYNDKALGDALGDMGMRLNNNPNLISAWVSNSNLRLFTNNATTSLDTLKIWQNPELSTLNVTANTALKWFDLRNCMIRDLDVNANTQLTYFDCSNLDSISAGWNTFNNYGFEMPRQVPTSMSEPGKNSIADLHFGSKALQVVRADNNDLYCMDGLNDNNDLHTLTYTYNHINGIDLSGCPNITEYDCYHNVRGVFMGELAQWQDFDEDMNTITCSMYYLQLVKDAGDALHSNDTFLGHKCGQDTIAGIGNTGYMRQLEDDGFDPEKVIRFTVNASGPYESTMGNSQGKHAPQRSEIVYGPDADIDTDKIYGKIAVIKMYDLERNYIEYLYDDGRPNSSLRDGGGSGFGLAWAPPGEATWVDETLANSLNALTVVSERYFDASGAEHSEPVPGINIVVRQMSDGSTSTTKVIK